jgi:hypothetical protein
MVAIKPGAIISSGSYCRCSQTGVVSVTTQDLGSLERNWLRFAKTPPALSALRLCALPKAHAWSTTVLIDELHAGCFECAFDDVESCPSRLTSPVFKLVDSNSSNSRLSGQILLAPG